MQSLQTDQHYDKQTAGEEILRLVKDECYGYLQAATHWMEERSLPMNQFARYIPETIIELITQEATNENMLKPSHAAEVCRSTLDFLYAD